MPDVAMADADSKPKADKAAKAPVVEDGPESSVKAIGVIQPPPDIKNIVDKTAGFVAKNGPQFEQRILTNERNTSKFGFLQPTSPYWPYYQKKLAEARAGLGAPAFVAPVAPSKPEEKADKADDKGAKSSATMEGKATVAKKRELKEPEADVYTVLPPDGLSIPTLDMEIIKLTAQYVALNGRSFLNGLLTRESRNPQFDFLKGHHFLFNYFTALVESYSKIINPPEGTLEHAKKDATDRVDILERAFAGLDWDAHVEKERQRQEDQAQREKETVAAIDWHDFKVVETIDFEEGEEDLPPPLSEQALRSLRLRAATAQEAEDEAKAAEEAAKKAAAQAAAAAAGDEDMEVDEGGDMDMEDDGEAEDQGEVDEAPMPPTDLDKPLNIVKNYVKPGQADPNKNAATKFMISPITGQQVPVEQMAEHMRIALLDPKWKEKSGHVKVGEKEDTIATSDEIGASLQKLASKRKDIFGTDEEVFGGAGSKAQQVQQQRAQQDAAAAGGSQSNRQTANSRLAQEEAERVYKMRLEAQQRGVVQPQDVVTDIIKSAEERMNSAVPPPPSQPPPPMSQQVPPPPPPGGQVPPPPAAQQQAPRPAGQPPAQVPPPPAPGVPPGQFGMQPPGLQPPGIMGMGMGMGMRPPGMPGYPPQPGVPMGMPGMPGMPMGMQPPGGLANPFAPQFLQQQPAAAAEPDPKKAKNEPELVPEAQWIAQHPGTVFVKVFVPQEAENAKNNFNGQTLDLAVEMTDTVKTLKDKLTDHLGGLAGNKQKITTAKHGVLKDNLTLGYYNFSMGENLIVGMKERGGRKK